MSIATLWLMRCAPQKAGIVRKTIRIDTSPRLAACGPIDSDRGQGVCMDARLRGTFGLLVLLLGAAGATAQSLDGQTVAEVSVRGQQFVTAESILAKIKTRKDRPYSQTDLQADVATLMATRQFSRVTPFIQAAPGNQVSVVLEIQEYPNVVQEIRYDGAKHLKDDELNTITGLKRGVPLNPIANKQAVNAILRKYHEQGRLYASVELAEGGNPGDSRVVFRITEGRIVK